MKFGILVRKWSIALKIIPILIVVVGLKLLFHWKQWEWLSLSPLFTSILAGTIFLLGFLISGVLSDYKESEKLPGELASSLEVMHDEGVTLKAKGSVAAVAFLSYYRQFLKYLDDWLFENMKTKAVLGRLSAMNEHIIALEKEGASTARIKAEQAAVRKIVVRIGVIRDTNFVSSAYAIVEALIFFLISGMVLVKIEAFYESLFFVVLVSFLVLYMLFLIRDLDNPFEYRGKGEGGSEVSLTPLHEFEERVRGKKVKGG